MLTERRRQAPIADSADQIEDVPATLPDKKVFSGKEYPRMSKIKLPDPIDQGVTLMQALERRRSNHQITHEPLSLEALSYILNSLGFNNTGSRTYPSGGGLYPVETYLLSRRVDGLGMAAYHYHAPTHSLEHLWEIPEKLEMFGTINAWAEDARAILIFTGSWYKSIYNYGDFSYLLGLIETGHIGQNILLAAAAQDIPACPLGGFNDDVVTKLLDLNPSTEQPIYVVALA